MNSRRTLLTLALLLVSMLIYQQWQMDYHMPKPVATEQSATQQSDMTPISASAATTESKQAQGRLITLKNDVFSLKIDTLGGDVVQSDLLHYAAELNSVERFMLLQNTADKVYVAESGLVGKNGIDTTTTGRAAYHVDGDEFTLADGQDELRVPLTFEKDGVTYRKIFVLKRGVYSIDVNYEIQNQSADAIEVQPYGQLKHTIIGSSGSMAMPTYTGGAYSGSAIRLPRHRYF